MPDKNHSTGETAGEKTDTSIDTLENLSIKKSETVSISYRPDIDGLRAIAVFAVLVFHAFPSLARGGFVGVDIFFVLSGFLISSILFSQLAREKFSFVDFYSRRIRRIYPSLLVILIACFIFGWFVLYDDEFRQLGKHIAGGAGFVANLVYWAESGYFDSAAETKPLLHLWSLGIEEQFYIIWPLLLWFSWKKRFSLLKLTVLILVGSFLLNIALFRTDTVADFFSPFTRFWELLAGALLAYFTIFKSDNEANARSRSKLFGWLFLIGRNIPKRLYSQTVLSVTGFVFILVAIFITKKSHFPGVWALIPVLGTLMMIAAGKDAWINKKLLSHKLLVMLGIISYPIYLWHWPLLSFAQILSVKTPDLPVRILIIPVSVLLAWLTFRFVENPLRFGLHVRIKTLVLFVLMFFVGLTGYLSYKYNVFTGRSISQYSNALILDFYADEHGLTSKPDNLVNECGLNGKDKEFFPNCFSDTRQKPVYLLMGDSKSAALFGGLVNSSLENKRWMYVGGYGGKQGGATVPLVLDQNSEEQGWRRQFNNSFRKAFPVIDDNPDIKVVVFMMAARHLFQLKTDSSIEDLPENPNYELVKDGLFRGLDMVVKAGKKVVLVVDNPTLAEPRGCFFRKTDISVINSYFHSRKMTGCEIPLDRQLELSEQYRRLLREAKTKFGGNVEIFDTTPILCDEKNNICSVSRNGRSLYSYTDHISGYSADLIGQDLNKFLAEKYAD